jgi:DNA polymerase I-like protein with 3'-5' exonuclease and polymerase domains
MATNLLLFEPKPAKEWALPKFKDLSSAKMISIDLETKDPLLSTRGPGTFRKDGYPVGISVASDTGFKGYFPFAHMMGGNMDKEHVVRYFKDLLKREDLIVVGAHLKYDLEWLLTLGIEVKGELRDIQIAEPLIDEEQDSYSLDALARKYLKKTKEESLLVEAASAYGLHPKNDLWQLHSRYVGDYAEADATETLDIYRLQWQELKKQNLFDIFNMECELIELLVKMRFQGVRVDLERAEQYGKEWKEQEEKLRLELKKEMGYFINVNSGPALARYCQLKGWDYPKTLAGNPSFDKIFLMNSDNPFFQKIRDIRVVSMLRTQFCEDLINNNHVGGRIHCEFTQTRREDGGTRTGRFSSKNPNLQQIPSRDKQLAPKIRSLFIPEDGQLWAKLDYSQQEPRVLTHYGYITKLRGADKIRDAYIGNKQTDFYTLVSKESGLERKPAKDLTLGICYAEGKDKIAHDLGVSVEEAMRLKEVFNRANPFIKELSDLVMNKVLDRGYVRTLLGRLRHFDYWEPRNHEGQQPVKGHAMAKLKWPELKLQRAFTYKGLNALIQGSSADMNKKAMLTVYKELGHIPLLTVHDELDYSVNTEMEAQSIQFRMENCVDITVPMFAELSMGKHWK